jgi:hypothetical protein
MCAPARFMDKSSSFRCMVHESSFFPIQMPGINFLRAALICLCCTRATSTNTDPVGMQIRHRPRPRATGRKVASIIRHKYSSSIVASFGSWRLLSHSVTQFFSSLDLCLHLPLADPAQPSYPVEVSNISFGFLRFSLSSLPLTLSITCTLIK